VVGTLLGLPLGVDAGSVLLIVALLLALMQLRGRSEPRAAGGPVRLLGWAYLAVLIVLVVSIPVGIALAHLRYPGTTSSGDAGPWSFSTAPHLCRRESRSPDYDQWFYLLPIWSDA